METGILGFGIRNTAQGIGNPANFGIRNPISINRQRLESSHWKLESTVWNPESRIEDCLGFPDMGQILSAISAVMANMLNKTLGLKTRLSAEPFIRKWALFASEWKIIFISMVNCALGLVIKLKWFFQIASGQLNVGFLLSPYFYWFYTPAALLWKFLLFSFGLRQSPHPQEFPVPPVGSVGEVWSWRFSESDIYVIRYLRSANWISWTLVL